MQVESYCWRSSQSRLHAEYFFGPSLQWLKQFDSTASGQYDLTVVRLGLDVQLAMMSVRHAWTTRQRHGPAATDPDEPNDWVSRVKIAKVARTDAGLYACVEVDQFGQWTSYGTGYLDVVEPPSVGQKPC